MRGHPVPGYIESSRHPYTLLFCDVVEQALQTDSTGRMANQPHVQAY